MTAWIGLGMSELVSVGRGAPLDVEKACDATKDLRKEDYAPYRGKPGQRAAPLRRYLNTISWRSRESRGARWVKLPPSRCSEVPGFHDIKPDVPAMFSK